MVETTDEINLVKEIERLESMYLHQSQSQRQSHQQSIRY